MTVQMISPSTTMKIATAMRKTIVYRSRIWAPWVVTATGGNSPPTKISPAWRKFTPSPTRIRLSPTMAAPTARAKIAVWEVRDLGELDIKILEKGGAHARGATTGDSAGASDRPGSNRGHSTRSASVSRAQDGIGGEVRTTATSVRGTISPMTGRQAIRATVAGLTGLLAAAVVAGPVLAHGPVPAEPPTATSLLLGWTWQPVPTLGITVAVVWWLWAVHRVDSAHPNNPVPRRRTVAFLAGMLALAFALISGIERYDTSLFSVHMVQHVLLMLVAAPLIALAAPITLVLRLASPDTRKRWVLPILHSRIVRVLAHPVAAWIIFAAMMWGTHFSALFNASLEDPLVHDLE